MESYGRATQTKEETRGASVEEEANLWKTDTEMIKYTGGTKVTLGQILERLEKQRLLSSDEVKWILNEEENPNKLVEIGSRNGNKAISFKVNEQTIADQVENGTIKIGDYIAYSPDTAEACEVHGGSTPKMIPQDTTLNWRVLDVLDGQVRLISELPTSSTVYLKEQDGYNNAVKLLDDLCSSLYSKNGVSAKVQSLKIEDIEKHLTYDYTTFVSYGSTFTLTNQYYPNIFAKENKQLGNGESGKLGLSQQDDWYTGVSFATTLNTTCTNWNKSMVSSDFKDFATNESIYYNLFINNGSEYDGYWLSSRCVDVGENNVKYNVRIVRENKVTAAVVYQGSEEMRVRPVILLKSGITVDSGDPSQDGKTSSSAWILK